MNICAGRMAAMKMWIYILRIEKKDTAHRLSRTMPAILIESFIYVSWSIDESE